MRRIMPLELAGIEKLDYDLYDDKGEIVCKSGELLTPDTLMRLSFKKLYRREDSIIKEMIDLIENDSEPKPEINSIISKTATENLVKSTKKILADASGGKYPEVELCTAASKMIIEEVGDKLEKIQCIGELRVFDEYTFSHTINVSTLSTALGVKLGLSESELKDLALGALLHDVGKMKIPKEILNKPSKLTPEEFQIMRNHSIYGYNVVKHEMNLSEKIALVALEHQERYGGEGYPNGLKGNEISQFAQIAAICDVYDALVSSRAYKKAIFSYDAIKIMIGEGGKSFNPSYLYKFLYLANYKDSKSIINKDSAIS